MARGLVEEAHAQVTIGLLLGLFLLLFLLGSRWSSSTTVGGNWGSNSELAGITFKYSLILSACGYEYSVSTATASTFLYPLRNMCGAAAIVGYEIARETEATIETPEANFSIRSSSVRSSTSGLKTDPLS
ncbi:Os08g0130550 [Oryza sativa Japonica Group]|uniref:Os08g0130550 protein n=1 Tax=Oryza sativa subsp. japonica TaxID=39947 RepID=A0A0P0XBD1_ORYSJ|nr:hypothetical protein EE612_041965 [Oryza sativa]BAT03695.1 Os08g0130550 [Oryza sativa Japonica Group]